MLIFYIFSYPIRKRYQRKQSNQKQEKLPKKLKISQSQRKRNRALLQTKRRSANIKINLSNVPRKCEIVFVLIKHTNTKYTGVVSMTDMYCTWERKYKTDRPSFYTFSTIQPAPIPNAPNKKKAWHCCCRLWLQNNWTLPAILNPPTVRNGSDMQPNVRREKQCFFLVFSVVLKNVIAYET